MATDDLPLNISVNKLADHISCPVCMCELRVTFMTPCGHRFCEKCIRECVDRHHKCPCCNAQVNAKHLIKDPLFDDIIETINREKEKAEKEYFNNLIEADSAILANGAESEDNAEYKLHISPVETVLKDHLKHSLVAHEHYYQELKRDLDKKKATLADEHKEAVEAVFLQGLSREEVSHEVEILQKQHRQQVDAIQQDFVRCGQLLAQAYDKYLSEHIPSMSILPVTISISLLHKSVLVPEAQLRPQDSTSDIMKLVCQHMEARGDKVVKFADNVKFFIFSPFAKYSLYEQHRMVSDIVERHASHPEIQHIPEGCRPVLEMSLKPGSVIAVYGQVQCESDLPKQCFAATFQKGQGQAMDYFSCKQCSFNWICRSCMDVCHKDHEVVPYIMNHQPTWACCYCPKKKTCVIQS